MRLCDPVIVLDRGARSSRARPDQVQTNPASSTPTWGDVAAILRLRACIAGYGAGDILRGVDLELENGLSPA